ncbi:putative ABC transporter permease [Desulfosporosinus nitroreducens]|uniref:ABC transporter permease n=1 Tax=Desulfosporosinus nitroreducens TaxID=2018668 RepID=A0ABT8QNM6_9FIRM|nr:putative ABC transporter permease [Desulfosporosinus nitroreducens]MCO1603229.1 putative ABC transporter permease [Desulfosporosinus nitroreducens]MDO0822209.1 putative ABC transporter permease [Desulfosporosinus nitroreducens]
MEKLKRFFIYGIIGLVVEVMYTGLASLLKGDLSMQGFTFLIMIPIYGLSVFLEPLHTSLRSHSWWIRGLIYLAVIWTIEYSSGSILALILGSCPWQYNDSLNINGYITLRMAPEWFLAGLGFEYLHDFMDKLPFKI